jgi:hypothetical protein
VLNTSEGHWLLNSNAALPAHWFEDLQAGNTDRYRGGAKWIRTF